MLAYSKLPYELINKRIPNIKFFGVFGCRCFILNDREDRGKLNAKADEAIFIGYSRSSVAYRVYNNWTKIVNESVNVRFDENAEMIYEYNNSEPGLTGVLATELIRSENVGHEI